MKLSLEAKSNLCRLGKDLISNIGCLLNMLDDDDNLDELDPLLVVVFDNLDCAYDNLDSYLISINNHS